MYVHASLIISEQLYYHEKLKLRGTKNAKVAKYRATFAAVNYSEPKVDNLLILVSMINPQ